MQLSTRILAFFLGCIGIRLLFVVAAKLLPTTWVQWAALPALALVVGWILIYRYDLRPTGREAGGEIWWNHLRPVHAALYAAFAVLALTKTEWAFIPLLLDVLVGLAAFGNHHWANGDFQRLMTQ